MRRFSIRTTALPLTLAVAVFGTATWDVAQGNSQNSGAAGYLAGYAAAVDAEGNIRVPAIDYRADWRLLGSWSIAGAEDGGGAAEFHVVYAQPGVIEAYRRDGVFPDGSVLVKELFGTITEDMTTGRVSRAAERSGWFVMVKDSSGRFDASPLWGEGWGWAYFDAADPTTTQTEDFKAACIACHEPARDSDWVYVEGYPALSR
ncbi:MAG: cytochrome P460 family protein [Kiloniellaceae bacterium]